MNTSNTAANNVPTASNVFGHPLDQYWLDDQDRLCHRTAPWGYGQLDSTSETQRAIGYRCSYCGELGASQREERDRQPCGYCGSINQWKPVTQIDPYLMGSMGDEYLIQSLNNFQSDQKITDNYNYNNFSGDFIDYNSRFGYSRQQYTAERAYEDMLLYSLKNGNRAAERDARIRLAWFNVISRYYDAAQTAWKREEDGYPEDDYGFTMLDQQRAICNYVRATHAALGTVAEPFNGLFTSLADMLHDDAVATLHDRATDFWMYRHSWECGNPVRTNISYSDERELSLYDDYDTDGTSISGFHRFRIALMSWEAWSMAQRLWLIEATTPNIPTGCLPLLNEHKSLPKPGIWTKDCRYNLNAALEKLDVIALKGSALLTAQQCAEYDATRRLSTCIDQYHDDNRDRPISPWDVQLRRNYNRDPNKPKSDYSYVPAVPIKKPEPSTLLNKDEEDLRQAKRIIQAVHNPSDSFTRYTSRLLRRLQNGVDYGRRALSTSEHAYTGNNWLAMCIAWVITAILIVILAIRYSTWGFFLGVAINFAVTPVTLVDTTVLDSHCPADAKSRIGDNDDPGIWHRRAWGKAFVADLPEKLLIAAGASVVALIAAAIVLPFARFFLWLTH